MEDITSFAEHSVVAFKNPTKRRDLVRSRRMLCYAVTLAVIIKIKIEMACSVLIDDKVERRCFQMGAGLAKLFENRFYQNHDSHFYYASLRLRAN